jgi:hypothetical protein
MQGGIHELENETGNDKLGWKAEVIPRHGRYLIIIYRDGESVGSLQVETKEDMELWKETITNLNNPQEKKEQK